MFDFQNQNHNYLSTRLKLVSWKKDLVLSSRGSWAACMRPNPLSFPHFLLIKREQEKQFMHVYAVDTETVCVECSRAPFPDGGWFGVWGFGGWGGLIACIVFAHIFRSYATVFCVAAVPHMLDATWLCFICCKFSRNFSSGRQHICWFSFSWWSQKFCTDGPPCHPCLEKNAAHCANLCAKVLEIRTSWMVLT